MPNQEWDPRAQNFFQFIFLTREVRRKGANFFSKFLPLLSIHIADHGVVGKLRSCSYRHGLCWFSVLPTRRNITLKHKDGHSYPWTAIIIHELKLQFFKMMFLRVGSIHVPDLSFPTTLWSAPCLLIAMGENLKINLNFFVLQLALTGQKMFKRGFGFLVSFPIM